MEKVTGLEALLRVLSEEKRANPRLTSVERQARIVAFVESRGRVALRAREVYRQLHLRREEFDLAVSRLVREGFLRQEGEFVVPLYNSGEPLLAYLQAGARRLKGPAGPLVAAPVRALALGLMMVAASLGAAALLAPALVLPEPPLREAALLASDACAGFGVQLGRAAAGVEVQIEREGAVLATGSAASSSGALYFCRRGGGFAVSDRLPSEGGVFLPEATDLAGRYLLVNATVRGRGILTEVLVPDFREDNRLDLAPEWAARLDGGFLVGARNRGGPLEGVFLLYAQNPNGTLSPLGRSGPLALGSGERVAFAVPTGTTYAVLRGAGGDGYLRLDVKAPFGTPGLPPAVRVG